jgi:hypothetical protein
MERNRYAIDLLRPEIDIEEEMVRLQHHSIEDLDAIFKNAQKVMEASLTMKLRKL